MEALLKQMAIAMQGDAKTIGDLTDVAITQGRALVKHAAGLWYKQADATCNVLPKQIPEGWSVFKDCS